MFPTFRALGFLSLGLLLFAEVISLCMVADSEFPPLPQESDRHAWPIGISMIVPPGWTAEAHETGVSLRAGVGQSVMATICGWGFADTATQRRTAPAPSSTLTIRAFPDGSQTAPRGDRWVRVPFGEGWAVERSHGSEEPIAPELGEFRYVHEIWLHRAGRWWNIRYATVRRIKRLPDPLRRYLDGLEYSEVPAINLRG